MNSKVALTIPGAIASAALGSVAGAGESMDEIVGRIRNPDISINAPACELAVASGVPAVKPLLLLMSAENDFELTRRAKRALLSIVRHAGRPGAKQEARQVESELIIGVQTGTDSTRRDILWLLSEIGTSRAVAPIAALLTQPSCREDARCALTRIPGKKATAALWVGFRAAPEDFKYALAESLRARGEMVEGYPSQRMVPTKQTTVKAAPPKTK